jgi:hypothetical protein
MNDLDKVSRSTSEIPTKKSPNKPSYRGNLHYKPKHQQKNYQKGEPFLRFDHNHQFPPPPSRPTPIKRKFNHNGCGVQQWRYIRPCEKAQLDREEVYVAHHSHNFPRMMYYQRPGQVVFGDSNKMHQKGKRPRTAGHKHSHGSGPGPIDPKYMMDYCNDCAYEDEMGG